MHGLSDAAGAPESLPVTALGLRSLAPPSWYLGQLALSCAETMFCYSYI